MKDDDALSQALNESLDASLGEINQLTLQKLQRARRHAQHRKTTLRHSAIGLAVAATVAAIAIVPWYIEKTQHADLATITERENMDDVDPQLLANMDLIEDMDMIEALGEIEGT